MAKSSKTQFMRVSQKDLPKAIKAINQLKDKGLLNAKKGGLSGTKCKATGNKDDFSCEDSD